MQKQAIEKNAKNFLRPQETELFDNFVDVFNQNQKIIKSQVKKYGFLDLIEEKNTLRQKEHDARVAVKKHRQNDIKYCISNIDLLEQPGPQHYNLPSLENTRKITHKIAQSQRTSAFDEMIKNNCSPDKIYVYYNSYKHQKQKPTNKLKQKFRIDQNDDEYTKQEPIDLNKEYEKRIGTTTISKEMRFADKKQKLIMQMGQW